MLNPARVPKGPAIGRRHRFAGATALIGFALALLALLAIGALSFSGPIADLLQGPDPCGAVLGKSQPDTTCLQAHREYYVYDPSTGYVNPRGSLISGTVIAVAWPAALPLALAASLISGLALAMGTPRRRVAITALTIGALIAVGIGFFFLILVGGGGD